MVPVPVALFDRLTAETITPRESVIRELRRFFNTRPAIQRAVSDKDTTDWREISTGDDRALQLFCRQLRDALLHHDPRIQALSVEVVRIHPQSLMLCLTMALRSDNDPLAINLNWQHDHWQLAVPGESNGQSITG